MTDTPHPWSRSPAAQAAIRRAEADTGPQIQHHEVPGRVEELEQRVRAIEERMGTASDTPQPVTAAGDSAGAVGVRTERVTLEVTHEDDGSAADWPWDEAFSGRATWELFCGESVRVVPTPGVGLTEEEREWMEKTQGLCLQNALLNHASAIQSILARDAAGKGNPPAPPQVHRGSGVFDFNGDEVPWEGVVAALTAERDAAIRERDESLFKLDRMTPGVGLTDEEREAMIFARDALLGHAVAGSLAKNASVIRHLLAQDAASRDTNHDAAPTARGGESQCARCATIGGTSGDADSLTADLAAERSQVEELKRAALADDETIKRVTADIQEYRKIFGEQAAREVALMQRCEAAKRERDAALARAADAERALEAESTARAQAVAELEAATAAPTPVATQEPVAWGLRTHGRYFIQTYYNRDEMNASTRPGNDIVPLYAAPPTPRVVRLPPVELRVHRGAETRGMIDAEAVRQALNAAGVAWEVGE